jgi:hypothetical protein
MKPALATAVLSAAVLLAGCAGARIGMHSEAPPSMRGGAPVAGSSYSSASIQVGATPNAYFGLLFLGYFAAGVHDSYLDWRYGPARREAPPLAADRSIAERDCSRPMAQPSANLRCR